MVCRPLLSLLLWLNRLQGLDLCDIELVVQWKYTDSLCTLWQRLGQAACNPSTEATGVYIVEPSYTDHHRIEAEGRAAVRAGKAQQKQLQGPPDADTAESQTGRITQRRPRHQPNQPNVSVSWPVGRLIVPEGRHKSYEEAAMDTYINAHAQGLCYCGVSDEFFDNRPGVSLYVIPLGPDLTCSQRLLQWHVPTTAGTVLSRPLSCVATPANPSHLFPLSLIVMIYHRDYDTDTYFSLLPYLPTCPPHSHPHLFGVLLPIVCYSYSALKAVL
jgi:hypothetical protein